MGIGKIAVLGGGPGSQATAGDLALRGFEVHFWGRDPWKLARLFQFKQIRMVGYPEGVGKLADASDDLSRILKDARLIIVVLPGCAHRAVAEQCAPFIQDGQIVLVCGNSGMGSVVFSRVFQEKGVKKNFLCAEYSGGVVGGRFLESGEVNRAADFSVGITKYGLHVGVFPARRTQEAMHVISQVYPGISSAENSLAACLGNRAVLHQPIMMLMGASAIEHLCYWDITAEGHTPSAMKVVNAVDDERKAIQKAWGLEITDLFGVAHRSGHKMDWDHLAIGSSGRSIRDYRVKSAWKDRLDMQHRFVTEAVPYGLVFRSSAAAKAGINVPITDSLIRLFSVINGEDYFSSGMSLDSLGLGGMNAQEILRLLHEGSMEGAVDRTQ